MGDGFLEKIFCGRVITTRDGYIAEAIVTMDEIAGLQTDIQNLQKEKQALIKAAGETQQQNLTQIDSLNKQIADLNAQIVALNAQLNNQSLPSDLQTHSPNFYKLPQATQTLVDGYMNKYPEAFVTYGGRYFGTNKSRYNLDVKAWLSEGINDFEIVNKVKNAKARVVDVLAEQPTITFHKACDIAFMRVTNALGDSVTYGYDQNTWGEQEFWNFASESRVIGERGGGIDCEDKSIYSALGCAIAGIPDELTRVGAGMTFSNEGHCTLFYFPSDLSGFRHRNSTTNYSANKSVLSLPMSGDSTESLNIKTFWFSFNALHSWNWFASTTAKEETKRKLKKDQFLKFINIINKNGEKVV
jgi:predicted transglutaminase-like cysteine proteinase